MNPPERLHCFPSFAHCDPYDHLFPASFNLPNNNPKINTGLGVKQHTAHAHIHQDNMQGNCVISYTVNREDEYPNWYWAIIETEKGSIHAEGESEDELRRDIIVCAEVLGYSKDKITLHKVV